MKFNYTKHTRSFLVVPAVISFLAIFALVAWGLRAGIDLTGGSLVQISFPQGRPTVAQIDTAIRPLDLGEIRVQPTGDTGYIFRAKTLTPEEKATFEHSLATLGEIHEDQFSSVGPTIGRELLNKGLIALGLVAFSIIIFIAFAFRGVSRPVASWKYGVIAIVTLIHDILIPTGLFAFLGYVQDAEVDSLFIVALLTLLGASINNTIVVFDRVRENLRKHDGGRAKEHFAETVSRAVSQTFARSMNTTITVIIMLVALYVWGPATTQNFSLTLIVGMIAGAYSSIFLAAPLLVEVERRQKKEGK